MKTKAVIPGILLAVFFSVVAAPASAEIDNKNILNLIGQLADKPSDHTALARYFRDQAAEARKQADMHKKMAQGYQRGAEKMESMRASMRGHCERLSEEYESAAKEYDQMAAEHEKMADVDSR